MAKEQDIIKVWELVEKADFVEDMIEMTPGRDRDELLALKISLRGLIKAIDNEDPKYIRESLEAVKEEIAEETKFVNEYLDTLTEENYLEQLEEDRNDAEGIIDDLEAISEALKEF